MPEMYSSVTRRSSRTSYYTRYMRLNQWLSVVNQDALHHKDTLPEALSPLKHLRMAETLLKNVLRM